MKIYATNKHPDIQDFVGQDVWVRCAAESSYRGNSDVFYNFTDYDQARDRYHYRLLPAHYVDDRFQDADAESAFGVRLLSHTTGNMPRWVFEECYEFVTPLEMYTTEELTELLGTEP